MNLYFGDLHNHCGISYGHGSLADALANAREQLDFVSITGHAHWPDMPERGGAVDDIIDFHEKGFSKLKRCWNESMEELRAADSDGGFVVFPGFEVHFSDCGDRNIVYQNLDGQPLYPDNLDDLHQQLRDLRNHGYDSIAQPHHIGYLKGTRGIDWDTFSSEFSPFVELVSMHGCSEASEGTRPFLHSMGPSDCLSTIQQGLSRGHVFGVTGGTDHHSAHPGSYSHGRLGVWATDNSRRSLWEAFYARRTYALTGDNIRMNVLMNGRPMGSQIPHCRERQFEIEITGGAAIDSVDLIRNNRIVKRFCNENILTDFNDRVRTIIHLELGWGRRNQPVRWQGSLEILDGSILQIEPRFRGREVVSPLEGRDEKSFYESEILNMENRRVEFKTVTYGNPNNLTNASQGIALHVDMPIEAPVRAVLNGRSIEWKLRDLLQGARSGRLGEIDSPAWRFHRAPHPDEFVWNLKWKEESDEKAYYYVRVRQANDQWAWSSPIFVGD